MQIDKRSRAELKQYFVRNAIPTESNFAELIDGMLSQRDDGIAKLPNDPLSIEAAGDDTSQKKAIHFYNSFRDNDPTWVLSLNPRQTPADPATAKPGFSISDAAGNSRLFIDRSTGNVGIGTLSAGERLSIGTGGTIELGAGVAGKEPNAGKLAYARWSTGLDIIGGGGPAATNRKVTIWSEGGAQLYGPMNVTGNISIGTNNSTAKVSLGQDLANTKIAVYDHPTDTYGIGLAALQFRLHVGNPSARFSFLNGAVGTELVTIKGDGKVGVGTPGPQRHLHIQGASSATFINDGNDRPGLAITGNYPELTLFSAIANANHGATIRLGSFSDDSRSAFKHWVIGTAGRNASFLDFGYSDKNDPNPHAGIRNYNGRTMMTLKENGSVGIGTTEPLSLLHLSLNGRGGPTLLLTNNDANSKNSIIFMGSGAPGIGKHFFLSNDWNGENTDNFTIGYDNAGAWLKHMTITSTGNVGIGTAAPNGKLDVYGFGRVVSSASNYRSVAEFGGGSSSNNAIIFNTGMTTGDAALRGLAIASNSQDFFIARFDSAGVASPIMDFTISSSGNVGIGTMTPGERLSIGAGGAIELGAGVAGKEPNAGRIAYARWTSGLEIVGGGGPAAANRRVTIWSEAGAQLYGSLYVTGNIISSGNVGIGTSSPVAQLDVTGVVRANRFMSDNTMSLNDYTTVNPPSNVYLYSPPGDRDAWIYLDSADTSSNWGIYHRQIDSPASVRGLPANSIGFIGGGSKLQAYIGLADGSAFFSGTVKVNGTIVPSVGNSEQAGILFPPDPGGGSGDRAFIRYFVTQAGTEKTKLLIGVTNDIDPTYEDTIGFSQGGVEVMTIARASVGIGTTAPKATAHIAGDTVLGADINNQRFVLHARLNGSGDFLQLTCDDINGNWDWNKGMRFIRAGGYMDGDFRPRSSRKIKSDIIALTPSEALDIVSQLNPVKFRYTADASKRLRAGFIAEEVPELVASDDRESFCLSDVVAALTRVVQSQQRTIAALAARIPSNQKDPI